MTMEEKGIYMMLLCHCWLQGSIPADHGSLRTLVGDDNLTSSTLENVLICFKKMNNNSSRLEHPFLQKEMKKQKAWKKKCSAGGRKSRKLKVLKTENKDKGSYDLVTTPLEVKGNIAVCSLQSSSATAVKDLKHYEQKKDSALSRERFEILWKNYPRKLGKEKALPKFLKQVGTEKDFTDIQQALVNYKADVERERKNGHPELAYQHGSTWFNENWKDYIDLKTETGESPLSQAHRGHGEFVDKAIRAIEYSITVSKEAGDKPDVKGVVQEIIEDALEDEKEALRIIYYNASYTDTKPESLK